MTNLLDLQDDDRWQHERDLHTAGHALALVLVGHDLTPDDLHSSLTLDRGSEHRPFVAAMGVVTVATAWLIDIARHDEHGDLDLGNIGDQIDHVLTTSGSCCYVEDADDEFDDDEFDEEGLVLLQDDDWVRDTVQRLLTEHWSAVASLVTHWSAGETVDPQQATTLLTTRHPSQWTLVPTTG